MIRTKNRLRLCVTLLILNLAFIWCNSLLPGTVSKTFSDWVKELLALLSGGKPSSAGGGGLLRKLAHFTEFACLGMCLRWFFGMLRTRPLEHWAYPLLAGILTACIDETIQVFVPGRGPSIRDVMIDTAGAVLGIGILSLIYHLKLKSLEENKL